MIHELKSNKHRVSVHVMMGGGFGVITERIGLCSMIQLVNSTELTAMCLMIENFKRLENNNKLNQE